MIHSSSQSSSGWRRLLHLAFPIWLTQMLAMSWGLLDTAMLAAFSNKDLAALALALGGTFYMALNVAGKGVLQALAPIAAHLYGQQRWTEIGLMARQAFWVALVLAALGAVILQWPGYLNLATVEPSVYNKAQAYLRVIAFGLLGSFGLRVISAMTQAIGRPHILTVLMLIGLGIKIPLNFVLVHGSFGFLAMGVVGCALATAIVNSVLCLSGLIYLWRTPTYKCFDLFRLELPDWRKQGELLRFGVPFGLGYWLEAAVFSALAVAMSKLGTEALAANQVVSNFANLLFTVPLAISLGAGKPDDAYIAGRFALHVAALLAASLAGAAWMMPGIVLLIYRPDPALASMIASLLGLLILYHLADALQSVASFLNRAHKNAWWPAIVYALCMWGALGLGWVLSYGLNWRGEVVLQPLLPGLTGFYVGQAVGLGMAGFLMWAYWRVVLVARAPESPDADYVSTASTRIKLHQN